MARKTLEALALMAPFVIGSSVPLTSSSASHEPVPIVYQAPQTADKSIQSPQETQNLSRDLADLILNNRNKLPQNGEKLHYSRVQDERDWDVMYLTAENGIFKVIFDRKKSALYLSRDYHEAYDDSKKTLPKHDSFEDITISGRFTSGVSMWGQPFEGFPRSMLKTPAQMGNEAAGIAQGNFQAYLTQIRQAVRDYLNIK